MMGGVEGDIALLCSMNISIKWKMAGVKDVILQWQWNGGHVPNDIQHVLCWICRPNVW